MTLEICSQFDLPMVKMSDELQDVAQIGIFSICLAAERVATDVHSYREKTTPSEKVGV